MAIAHMFDTPPQGVATDWTMPQNWNQFTAEEHDSWDKLVDRQSHALERYASRTFLNGLNLLHLTGKGIPDYRQLNPLLHAATGWEVVAVPGIVPNDAFFQHLSERRFPAANFLREADSLDYSEEPDMFHDLFGHLPMLANPVFAEFMVQYGRAGLRAEQWGMSGFLARLYLHTVEFGLVNEADGLRAYGAGMLSSYAETVHALTDADARHLRFDLPRVMRTDYLFDKFQRVYFVVDSFEELLRVMEETDFAEVYRIIGALPMIAPEDICESDQPYLAEK
ncbi:phenylalanine 4-monooxygenase [Sphingobium sp.]|uniref:phenylalanine 4-monooxygenase n=1 Tax=Sphingobium sp. TaxID=1912891 RepID=UPI0028BF095F|nr:phenylalanine 4-monooxygenase [Sphingobium sp.]